MKRGVIDHIELIRVSSLREQVLRNRYIRVHRQMEEGVAPVLPIGYPILIQVSRLSLRAHAAK